jgi:hypothetical protein
VERAARALKEAGAWGAVLGPVFAFAPLVALVDLGEPGIVNILALALLLTFVFPALFGAGLGWLCGSLFAMLRLRASVGAAEMREAIDADLDTAGAPYESGLERLTRPALARLAGLVYRRAMRRESR